MFDRRLAFGAACLGMLLFGVVLITLGSILPGLTAKFALNDIAAGSLAALLPAGILAGSVVFGPVADRYGYRALLVTCTVVVFLGLEGISFARGLAQLRLSMFLLGFGGGILNGATNALVSDISAEGRGAGLSLLGVFFGAGALGMPVVLGLLSPLFTREQIIAGVGAVVLLCSVFLGLVRFPAAKQTQGFPLAAGVKLLRDGTLVLLAAVLFFQSGLEGIVSNWTTTFLQKKGAAPERALLALTLYVAGLTAARLLLTRILKRFSLRIVMLCASALAFAGGCLLMAADRYALSVSGLILLGAGFAAVFPVVLGIVGDLYSTLSGTAFSIVFVIALTGNTLVNYLTGHAAQGFGIGCLPYILLANIVIASVLLRIAFHRVEGHHAG